MFRDFTYIDDIISGIKKIINNKPRTKYNIYDIGNNNTIKITTLIKTIEKILNKKAKINFEEMQPGDVLVTMSNIKPLKDDFNYSPKTDIESGMKKFIDWFQNGKNN